MPEVLIGKVKHYFSKISVAAIELEDKIKVGDKIHIAGHSTDITSVVESIQIEHESIQKAERGQIVGIKVPAKVREGDKVFLVKE